MYTLYIGFFRFVYTIYLACGHRCGLIGKLLWVIGKLKKDSAAYTHQCSGEGREKREGKSLCGGNHITSLLYLREERKKVLTHSCKGILHLHTYACSAPL